MLSKVSAWALLLTAPTVAQAQTNNQYDSETLLEAMDVSATQGIEVGADGCAIQVPIEEGQPRIKRDSSVWSGECVHGLANGFGHFTVNGKNSEIQTIYMGLNPPRAVFKDGFTQIKAADGSYVWRRGPEDVIAASRNGYDAYIIHKKINGVDRMVRRIASVNASCYKLPNLDKSEFDLSTAAAVENYEIMIKECAKVREAQWDHRSVEVVVEAWWSPEQNQDVTRYHVCRFNKWTGTIKEKDQVYCNNKWAELKASIKPEFDAVVEANKSWNDTLLRIGVERKETIAAKYTAALASVEARNKQKKQEETALASNQIRTRQQAFLAGPKGAPFRAKAGAVFSKPATTDQTAVLYLGFDREDGNGYEFMIEDDMFGLPAGVEPGGVWFENPELGKPQLTAEFAKLAKAGTRTVYVLYMDRMDLWEGPISFTPRTENVLMSSTTSANPDYARVQRELQQAKIDFDRAQAEYDAVASRANSGGYGSSTVGAVSGVFDSIGAGSKLENARTRYETLNRQFTGMSAQNTSETRANISLGDVTYRSELRRPLVIFACDLVTAMCSEKERTVNHSVSVQVPMAIVPGEAKFDSRKGQVKTARTQINEYEKKLQFGFSLDQLGDFMNGTTRAVPLSLLLEYVQYADKEGTKAFEASLADVIAKNTVANGAIAQAATTLPQRYEDVFGMVRNAAGAKREAERKQGLQGLE
ncbi:MAG: hypothetical protein IPN50_00110 [Sphingomonadales bacterium]|jgi:hypothetical protein|uniref:hypothetical protein n=3 Tax=Sphingorhabdus sp. TaxID=1902408 RepID=UPI003BAF85E9|nr:hypothetical protein [Sphingomonadales bacterium]MBK9430863.1 hypothetical protein [Sphingomonadales bacterium]